MKRLPRYWIFDLDNTLYPPASGLFDAIDRRINRYLQVFLELEAGEAERVRKEYLFRYGLTLVGLMRERKTDPGHYLDYVHQVPVERYLKPNRRLQALLHSIPSTKVVFTNGSRRHSQAVMKALGISGAFEKIFDIASVGYIPKPDPRSYRTVLKRLGAEGSETVLVEDLPRNLPPAKEMGMTTILVGDGNDAAADFVVPSIEKLPTVLGSVLGRTGACD
jgi:putative hydrolase of the HAD superfamily